METKTERRLTLKTASGCRMLLAISIAIIRCLAGAHLLTSDGGTVKVSLVKIDDAVRLWMVNCTSGRTTDEDNLPAVIVTRRGCCMLLQEDLRRNLLAEGLSS